jgi:DNA helicase IV
MPRRSQTARPDLDALTAPERRIVLEEEELLERVLATLRARRPASRAQEVPELLTRLKEFRDEAVEAAPKDLPTVFQEMNVVRALLDRRRGERLPEPASPYFAHLRVREGGEVRDYCLGRGTFVDRAAGVRVVDWRWAPIAALFYRYREGEAFEEPFPGRTVEGVVEVRRVVVVERGVLVRISAGALTLIRAADGTWSGDKEAARLGGGQGTAARAGVLGTGAGKRGRAPAPQITALLDREQYEALSAPADDPLLVIGSAGSGKTTVALHRLARLAFEDPRRFAAPRLQVVVPETGLAKLVARLLEPLGLGKVAVRTLDAWARAAFQSAFRAPPPRIWTETPSLVSRLKRHPSLYAALKRRPHVAGAAVELGPLRREIGDLFSDREFLATVVRDARGDLPTTAIEEVVRHTRLQLAPPPDDDLAGVDADRRETLDGLSISERTPDAVSGTLDPEDLAVLLFLAAFRAGAGARRFSHLVVDEAEDVSLFELHAIGRQLEGPRSITVAGDEGQQTFTSYAGWKEALAALGIRRAATCRLAVTYRCPEPIADFAQAVLGRFAPAEPARAGRKGAPVARFDFPAEAHAHLFLSEALRDLVEREPRASVAVIAHSPDVARGFHRLLADLPEVRLVLDGEFSFRPGVDVTEVGQVKGLEFDYVVVPDASAGAYPDSEESRRRLHVAVTRASHQLWITTVGRPSPLVESLRSS